MSSDDSDRELMRASALLQLELGRSVAALNAQLIFDPERIVKRLLAQCDLAFEDDGLKFYETRRFVTTISSEQVRRPITSEGVE